jgi:signal transduction histidine kinase
MLRIAVVLGFALLVAMPAQAGEFGTRDEAVAMVKRLQERFKAQGAEATFKAVTDKDPAFHDRDLYPFIYTLDGKNVAHGANAALVGKNLIDLKDQSGKFLIREIIDVAKGPGSGWVDYKWPNPVTQKIDDKASYVERMGDYAVGVGVYR